ncbi:hypothetical protein BB558_003665 [Smittium angustum]|uniref:Transporter n=1 Tax=Smittium angustum TaxID=133377 RepID=A0A2U1J5D9_SMIAN|nr:hypothetical protein BB558_003665 [Smittium angustum]
MGGTKKSKAARHRTINSTFHSLNPTPAISPYSFNVGRNPPFYIDTDTNSNEQNGRLLNNTIINSLSFPKISLPANPVFERNSESSAKRDKNNALSIGHIKNLESSGVSSQGNSDTGSNVSLSESRSGTKQTDTKTVRKELHWEDEGTQASISSEFYESTSINESTGLLQEDITLNQSINLRRRVYLNFKENYIKVIDVIKACLTMPVYAIIFGIISVVIPSIKNSLLDTSSPFNIFYSAIDLCGDACVPLVILSLGGQLGQMQKESSFGQQNGKNISFLEKSKMKALALFNLIKEFPNYNTLSTNQPQQYPQSPLNETIPRVFVSYQEETHSTETREHSHSVDISPKNNGDELKKNLTLKIQKSDETCNSSNPIIQTGYETLGNGKVSGQDPEIHNSLRMRQSKNHIVHDEDDTNSINSDLEIENRDYVSNSDQKKGIFIVLFGRFLFVPIFAIIILLYLRSMFPKQAALLVADPVFFFTLLILSATPPAINLITVAQSTGRFENEAGHLLMWSYLLGIFTLSAEVGFFMWLTNRTFNN